VIPAAADEVVVPEGMQITRAADLTAAVVAAGLGDDARGDRPPAGARPVAELPDGVARLAAR
jgi:hypothetical protein